jgi:hypothetical protein
MHDFNWSWLIPDGDVGKSGGKRKNHFLILKHHFMGKDDSLRAIGYLHGSTLLQ